MQINLSSYSLFSSFVHVGGGCDQLCVGALSGDDVLQALLGVPRVPRRS